MTTKLYLNPSISRENFLFLATLRNSLSLVLCSQSIERLFRHPFSVFLCSNRISILLSVFKSKRSSVSIWFLISIPEPHVINVTQLKLFARLRPVVLGMIKMSAYAEEGRIEDFPYKNQEVMSDPRS
jgi:hypothetical protein